MRSPELVDPSRLESLLAGAFPETHREARLQGAVRELRSAHATPPPALRDRVLALSPAPARVRRLRPTRPALALAAVLAVGAALAGGTYLLPGGGSDQSGGAEESGARAAGRNMPPEIVRGKTFDSADTESLGLVPLGKPSATPAQDLDMWIDLRVDDGEAVSSGAEEAMRITRDLGGVVVSSSVETRSGKGEADLRLRIPSDRVEDALFRLSQLGTIVGQQVETEDLSVRLGHETRRIARLRSEIRIELARIASGQLDAAEELQARIRLERLRTRLADARRGHAATRHRAAMADLTLRFATAPVAAAEKDEGGVGGAFDRAVDLLRGAGSVAVFLAVVLSPVLLLVVLAWLALRARSRRLEARLLTEPRPGAPARERST
jgi:hypothetical protein